LALPIGILTSAAPFDFTISPNGAFVYTVEALASTGVDAAMEGFKIDATTGALSNIGAFKVEKFITTDGFKYLLPNNEWVAFRASGTEPLIRCYIEAKSATNLKKLKKACQDRLQQ